MKKLYSILLTLGALPAFAGNVTYLALGDSISFGYNPNIVPPPVSQYIGYPQIVAADLHLPAGAEINASCPGQTSASFLNYLTPDNGCQAFISTIGLHTSYAGSQAAFAAQELLTNPINLVTLSIGGDDLLLLQQQCSPPGFTAASFQACVQANLPGVLSAYAENLTHILAEIRSVYKGKLVLVLYSAPNTDPLFTFVVEQLNSVMELVSSNFGATIGDGFTAFQIASALFGGDPCKAGLLVPLKTGGCDVHPTVYGQGLLALTVLQPHSPVLTSGSSCNGAYAGTFNGNVTVSNLQVCILVGGGVTGNIDLDGGVLAMNTVTIGGNVQAEGAATLSIGPATVIDGNLQIQNLPSWTPPSQVCGASVKGNFQFQNNGNPIAIGSAPSCPGNMIGGNLQVHNNSGATAIFGNTVGGNLQDLNNTGPSQVFGNTVQKNLQCQNDSAITGGGNLAAQKQGQCSAF
jgi:hypothetical protein